MENRLVSAILKRRRRSVDSEFALGRSEIILKWAILARFVSGQLLFDDDTTRSEFFKPLRTYRREGGSYRFQSGTQGVPAMNYV